MTSIDISEQQLDVARSGAAAFGLNVTFVRADVVDLSCLGDATFDLVYTGGHVAVWVSDLQRCYGEAARILRPDGLLIVSEYHPVRHPEDADDVILEQVIGQAEATLARDLV